MHSSYLHLLLRVASMGKAEEALKVTFESSSSIPWQLVLDRVVHAPLKIEPVNLMLRLLHHNYDGYVLPAAARRPVCQVKTSQGPRKARPTQGIAGRLHHVISAHSDLFRRSAYHG
jgi:hypothetical protein